MKAYVRKKKRATSKKGSADSKKPAKRKKRVIPRGLSPKKKPVKKKKALARKPKKAASKSRRRTVPQKLPRRSGGQKSTGGEKRLKAQKKPAKKRVAVRPAARKIPRRKRSTERKPSRKDKPVAAKRKALQAKATKLAKKLDTERGKLRTKKVRVVLKKRKKQEAKVTRAKKRLAAVITDAPKTPPKKKSEKEEREERFVHNQKALPELLVIAKKTKQFSKVNFRKRRMDTSDRIGDERTVAVNVMLDDAGVEEVMYQVEKTAAAMPGNRTFWICRVDLVGMGERIIGYGNRILKANHPDAHKFQFAVDSSGITGSLARMLVRLRITLEEYATEEYTVVFLLNYSVANFSFK